MIIIIPTPIKNTLIEYSNNEDIEVCFILLGNITESINVKRIVKITNERYSSSSFKFKQSEADKTCQYAHENGYDIIGVFHSHPTASAAPSERDIESMKSSDMIWFIYSGINNNMFAFTHKDKLESIQIEYN